MGRTGIITILSLAVAVFCLHNVYQSWLIVHTGSDRPITAMGLSRSRTDGGEKWQAIQIIAGGLRADRSRDDPGGVDVVAQFPNRDKDDNMTVERELTMFNSSIEGHRNGGKEDSLRTYLKDDHFEDVKNDGLFMEQKMKTKCHYNGSASMYKTMNGTKRIIPIWQRRLEQCGRLGRFVNGSFRFNLVELLQVRIYEEDKAKWTVKELKQWIHFMFLSGVEHIFVCDHYKYDDEQLNVPLKRYIDLGLVTYLPWSKTRSPMSAQIRCYQHIIDTYKQYSRWQIAIDMDEYPFALRDWREGFLTRYIRNATRKYGSRVTEISLSNYLMLGQGDRDRDMVISRINRMTPKPANVLVKPIYRPDRVRANIHHNHLLFGMHMNADNDVLRMLHYWGARVQDWGPDTPHTLAITKEMNEMRDAWSEQVRNSLLVFGEFDAFGKLTGP